MKGQATSLHLDGIISMMKRSKQCIGLNQYLEQRPGHCHWHVCEVLSPCPDLPSPLALRSLPAVFSLLCPPVVVFLLCPPPPPLVPLLSFCDIKFLCCPSGPQDALVDPQAVPHDAHVHSQAVPASVNQGNERPRCAANLIKKVGVSTQVSHQERQSLNASPLRNGSVHVAEETLCRHFLLIMHPDCQLEDHCQTEQMLQLPYMLCETDTCSGSWGQTKFNIRPYSPVLVNPVHPCSCLDVALYSMSVAAVCGSSNGLADSAHMLCSLTVLHHSRSCPVGKDYLPVSRKKAGSQLR